MTEYRYEYSEWSVDTRTWVLTSKKQLTEEEVYEIFHTETDIDEEGEVVLDEDKTLTYLGTRYGNSESEVDGNFKEEED